MTDWGHPERSRRVLDSARTDTGKIRFLLYSLFFYELQENAFLTIYSIDRAANLAVALS